MAVGIVSLDTISQPKKVRDAKVIAKSSFNILLGLPRVPIGIQETGSVVSRVPVPFKSIEPPSITSFG